MSRFNKISKTYERDSIVQRSASEILLELLDIKSNSTVLDLGCGTGHLTSRLKEKTGGTVVGVDPAEGMIEKAKEKYAGNRVMFRTLSADQLDYREEFDAIFCNSVFQWFSNPLQALGKCHTSLKPGGKIAIQAPARNNYCPNFLEAIEEVKTAPSTRDIYAAFNSPWFFLETAENYQDLFESAGFSVKKATIEKVVTCHSAAETFKIFESGASAGYLNQEFYEKKLPDSYLENFRNIVMNCFTNQAVQSGEVKLIFYRIYLLAAKEA